MKLKSILGSVVIFILLFSVCSGEKINSWEIKKSEKIDKLVFFGDSLTAGFGLQNQKDSFPNLIASSLNLPFERFSFSGYTTSDALNKLNGLANGKNKLIIVTLGGNDLLRSRPLNETEENLKKIFKDLDEKGYTILYTEVLGLIGGKRHQMHLRVCKELKVALVPDIMAGVFSNANLMQSDSVHPAASGCKVIAEKISTVIKDLELTTP